MANAWGDDTWSSGGWGGLTPGVSSGWGAGPWSSRAWGGVDTDRALTGSSASGSAGTPAFQNAGSYNSTTADVIQLYNSASNWTTSSHCSVSAGFSSEL